MAAFPASPKPVRATQPMRGSVRRPFMARLLFLILVYYFYHITINFIGLQSFSRNQCPPPGGRRTLKSSMTFL